MSADLALRCRCGAVTGRLRDVGPHNGDRMVCHCSDCQAFAHFCGHANEVLDAAGGTDLYQARCAALELDHGHDALACVHLTEKPTLRWYCGDCRSPLFNTFATARIPYVTSLLANAAPEARDAVGESRGHLFVEDAPVENDLKNLTLWPLAFRVVKRMARDLLSGDRRRSALFDSETLEPIAEPHRLSLEERAALNARREAAA